MFVEVRLGKAREGSLRRNNDFVRLWTGGAVSGLGSAIAALAYPLLALSVTDSAGRAGLLGLVALSAGALMRLPAGALVDRLPLRHVVSPAQLPAAFALDDGRGHAVSLVGQPTGGFLYGIVSWLPLVADLVSFLVSAVVSATIKAPLQPSIHRADRPRTRTDLFTGLTFLWREPFLRATLFAASGYQLVFAGATFALIARFTAAGATPGDLGILFAVAAFGGILGAIAAPFLQSRLRLRTVVVTMGWTAAVVFACFAGVEQPLLAGALLGCIFFTSSPANAILSAAQIIRTPSQLQGRVMGASYLIAGLAVPLGPPLGGTLLDTTSPLATFLAMAAATGVITVGVHLNRPMRDP